MGKIDTKLVNIHKMVIALDKAITKLQRTTDPEDLEFIQDSVVARFKILIESLWKLLKEQLIHEGLSNLPNTPKGVLEFAKEARLIDQAEQDQFVQFWSLRNFATHLYDQPQYFLVVEAAPAALALIKAIVARLEKSEQ